MLNYKVVESYEWTYPDIDFNKYGSGSDQINIISAKNSYATVQILLKNVPADGKMNVTINGLDDFDSNIYELYPIYVESNPFLNQENVLPHFPERWAPYYIYDCLKPFTGNLKVVDGVSGLYLSFYISADAAHGIYNGSIKINEIEIPIVINVYNATVPAETLKFINGYSQGHVAKYHGVEYGSEKWNELNVKYLKMMRHMRQNMLYTPGPSVTALGDNKYSFDFSRIEQFVSLAMSLGFKYFNGPSIGGRRSWKESTILVHGMPSMEYEAYCYLTQYLPAFVSFLKEKGWINNFYMGIADEPNAENATEFRALCGLVRKLAPEIKLMDAMSYGNLHGALDIWIPLNAEYDNHMKEIETFRMSGDEIWHYVCCGPRHGGYINRFMDIPLLATRYLFWGNYKYNLKGYLHWAVNVYQPGQDPFIQNCPSHTNADSTTTLPSGDTHLIYPGDGEPWMAMRLEAQRESAEEYELLKLLAEKNKKLADEICNECFKSFKDVEYDPVKFKKTKAKLLESLAE